jgi:hypothetical protein
MKVVHDGCIPTILGDTAHTQHRTGKRINRTMSGPRWC